MRLLRRVSDRRALIGVAFATVAYGFVVLLTNSLMMLLGLILASAFIFDFRMPVTRVFFHRFIPSEIRGTSGSFEEMLNAVGRLIGMPLVGILLDTIGPRYTVFASAMVMLPVIVLYQSVSDDDGDQ